MRIDPISVDKLKNYDWYYSASHNSWYYFKKRKSTDLNSTELDDTLDSHIGSIVSYLNSRGFDTLPSCEGHNRTKKFIDTAWKNLLSDLEKIRSNGLWLYNCENKDRYFLLDKNWEIPFSYEQFSDICSGKDGVVGYIGFRCNDRDIYNLIDSIFNNNSYVKVKFDGRCIEIFNNAKNDKIRFSNWRLIERVIKDVIK